VLSTSGYQNEIGQLIQARSIDMRVTAQRYLGVHHHRKPSISEDGLPSKSATVTFVIQYMY